MATRPPLTENADTPLSSDELEGDRAASPQESDPRDWPDAGELPADDDSGTRSVEADITLLPPG